MCTMPALVQALQKKWNWQADGTYPCLRVHDKFSDRGLDSEPIIGVAETLTYMDFPEEHWKKIRTNNAIERLNREIRRRTRVIGTFPDGESALMLVCARLRHVVSTQWGSKKYMDMKHLYGCDAESVLD